MGGFGRSASRVDSTNVSAREDGGWHRERSILKQRAESAV